MSGAMGKQQVKPRHIGHLEFLGQPFDHVPAIVFDATEYLAFPPSTQPTRRGRGWDLDREHQQLYASERTVDVCV